VAVARVGHYGQFASLSVKEAGSGVHSTTFLLFFGCTQLTNEGKCITYYQERDNKSLKRQIEAIHGFKDAEAN